MINPVLWILLALHLLGVVLFLVLRLGRLRGHPEYILPALLLPVFGPLLAITIELMHRFGHPGMRPVELEALRLEQNVYWNSVERPEADPSVVSLEEAILINDKHTRREAVLDTFRHDSFGFLDVLLLARDNEDTDTTHYATIRITKIHRQFQLALQQSALDYEQSPDDVCVLDKYLDLLEKYIESPLPDDLMLSRQKTIYARLLDRKLVLAAGDRRTLLRKLRLFIATRENYPAARALADELKARWPADESTWVEALRLCVEWHDPEALKTTLQQLRAVQVDWTRQGRALVEPWLQPAGGQHA